MTSEEQLLGAFFRSMSFSGLTALRSRCDFALGSSPDCVAYCFANVACIIVTQTCGSSSTSVGSAVTGIDIVLWPDRSTS